MARFANQSIFQLRGVKRLSDDEKLILANHVAAWMEAEVAPNDTPDATDDDG